jgi:hypothetical protein
LKLLALLTMLSGFLLAVLTLRIAHGEFDDLGLIALSTAVPNALSALIAWLLIRQKKRGNNRRGGSDGNRLCRGHRVRSLHLLHAGFSSRKSKQDAV